MRWSNRKDNQHSSCCWTFPFVILLAVLLYNSCYTVNSLPNDFIKTPAGWSIVLISQEIGNVCSCITVTVSMSLYSCLMIYTGAFLHDVSSSFHHLDDLNAKRPKLGAGREREMKAYFVETLKLHNWVLQ